MSSRDHLVILFGAGATRGALKERLPPPPLDGDFFDVAGQITGRGTRRLAIRVLNDVFAIYGRVSGVPLEQYYREIETRAEIGSFAKSKNKPKDWPRGQHDLEELIRRVILHTTCELHEGPARALKSPIHEEILHHSRPGDTLVTFNYDTVIEEAFSPNTTSWDPGDGYGVDATGKTYEWAKAWRAARKIDGSGGSGIHLLKLHGSLNWTLSDENQVRLKPRPYVVRSRRGAPVFDKCSILPPGWHKRIDKNPYRKLWREARLKLESCSALAIIGYSLPETDLLAKALFAEVSRLRAARRQFLEHLYVADPADAAKDRLIALLVPALGAKGRVYRYDGIDDLARAWKRSPPKR